MNDERGANAENSAPSKNICYRHRDLNLLLALGDSHLLTLTLVTLHGLTVIYSCCIFNRREIKP